MGLQTFFSQIYFLFYLIHLSKCSHHCVVLVWRETVGILRGSCLNYKNTLTTGVLQLSKERHMFLRDAKLNRKHARSHLLVNSIAA